MGDRLAIIDISRKVGGAVPLFRGELGPHLTQCRLPRHLPPYQVASVPCLFGGSGAEVYLRTKWHLNPSNRLATTGSGRKLGAVPLLGRGAGSPSDTVWPGRRPISVPSFIFIHPTVWPQYANVTDRQDRQTGQSAV